MSIPPDFIHDLLSRVDIVELIGRHVKLKRGGANHMGLCPFHGEKSPSFSVSASKQFFHCFGCGKHGDAVGFLMEHAGLSFPEAVRELAQEVGLEVPQTRPLDAEQRAQAEANRQRQLSLHETLQAAARAYQYALKHYPPAIAYLKGRGLTGAIAKRYGLGYAPAGWRALAGLLPDYQAPQLVESGLVIAEDEDTANPQGKRYDRFRDRIMFPIRDVRGHMIGFGGRVLGAGEPKYLNSPETPVFHKGQSLYGLFEARRAIQQQGLALVVEGYMDVVALAQHGVAHAVATLGTACTAEHLQLLLRHTSTVVFAFDGDTAGQRAAHKAMLATLPLVNDVRTFRFLFLPTEHDPDSFVRAHGSEVFDQQVAQATPLSQWMLQSSATDLDLNTAEGRSQLAAKMKPLWQAIPGRTLFGQQMLRAIAQASQTPAEALMRHYQANQPAPRADARQPAMAKRPVAPPKRALAPLPKRGQHALRLLMTQGQAWSWLAPAEQQLLRQMPGTMGQLAQWLESQWNTHGAQSWAQRRLNLPDGELGELARQLMQPEDPGEGMTPEDARYELSELLRLMHIDDLQAQQRQALAQMPQDPASQARYRALAARIAELKKPTTQPQ